MGTGVPEGTAWTQCRAGTHDSGVCGGVQLGQRASDTFWKRRFGRQAVFENKHDHVNENINTKNSSGDTNSRAAPQSGTRWLGDGTGRRLTLTPYRLRGGLRCVCVCVCADEPVLQEMFAGRGTGQRESPVLPVTQDSPPCHPCLRTSPCLAHSGLR